METEPTFELMLATLRRRLPGLFVERWDGVSGEALMRALARVGAEVQLLIANEGTSILFREATGAARAVGSVTIAFDLETEYDYTIPAGQKLFKASWGAAYKTTEAISRYAGQAPAELEVAVEAEWVGPWHNIPDTMVTQWAFDSQNQYSLEWESTGDAGQAEFTARVHAGSIRIVTSSRMTGGKMGTLDLRGAGRGLPRADGESDDAYRARARTISQNAITPRGIVRAVDQALGYAGASIVEYWNFGLYWGRSYWGRAYWTRRLHAVVLVPDGSDIASLQALVNEIRLPTVYIRVLPRIIT